MATNDPGAGRSNRFQALPPLEEEFYPAHGASITERPTAAARCECQFAVRHGERPIADRGLMLTLVDSHGDPLARSNAIRVVGNGLLEVAVTVYICDR